jgi:hypothetical protein
MNHGDVRRFSFGSPKPATCDYKLGKSSLPLRVIVHRFQSDGFGQRAVAATQVGDNIGSAKNAGL